MGWYASVYTSMKNLFALLSLAFALVAAEPPKGEPTNAKEAAAKKAAHPWEMAKGFDASAPCSALLPADQWPDTQARIELDVNSTRRQEGAIDDLIWPVADVIAHLSQFVALAAGDVIFTGTPEGVAALVPGDVAVASVTGLPELTVRFTAAEAE